MNDDKLPLTGISINHRLKNLTPANIIIKE